MIRVKVCCIQSVAEAEIAWRAGVHALGLVGPMPSGPGPISLDEIREIAAHVPPGLSTVLLTSSQHTGEIEEQVRFTGVNTVQLVDAVSAEALRILRHRLTGVKLMPVIHVRDEDSVRQAQDLAPHSDALLLDSGNPTLKIKELGGTGRTHDWSVSRRIVKVSRRPVFLAGGLKPENVRAAVGAVGPFGVDVCSGLRPGGPLHPQLLRQFLEELALA